MDVRVGIIGLGNAGLMHARSLLAEKIDGAKWCAVCDSSQRLDAPPLPIPTDVATFDNFDDMLDSGVCDAVVVATPHRYHPEQCMRAFDTGHHVFCEKPAGITVSSVRRMNAMAAATDKVFAMHFNRRLEPVFQTVRRLLTAGELGEIYRINWTATNWYRPDSYFATSTWRGTWAGEGGGVLLNQCIHDLDTWQYLFGLPQRVHSLCRFGRYHDIEVEDDVTAILDYDDGRHGVLILSTGESPGTNRLEVVGAHGKLVVEDRVIHFHRTDVPLDEFNRAATGDFGEPQCSVQQIPVDGEADLASGLLKNFVAAIRHDAPLLVPGQEGLASLEMANAILLSSWRNDWVELPLDDNAYDQELERRMTASKLRTPTSTPQVFDLKDSFK